MGQVINVQKQKNHGQISAVAKHNLRMYNPTNADPKREKDNVFLIGSKKTNVLQEIEDKLDGIKFRKDANKVVNLVFSASKEEISKIDVMKWANEINAYCSEKFGKDNVLYSVLHRDELTEHLHFSFVPLREGKLQSNYWFDGPAKLSAFRQEIYQINKKYGFKKDSPAEKAQSDQIESFYKDLNDLPKLEKGIEKDLNAIAALSSFTMNHKKAVEKATPHIANILKVAKAYRYKNKKLNTLYLQAKKETQRLKEENAKFEDIKELQALNYIQLNKVKQYAQELIKEVTQEKTQETKPANEPEKKLNTKVDKSLKIR